MQLRPVQTYFAQQVLELLSDKTDHQIRIDRVKVSWLDKASLNDLLILDRKNDTLLYSKSFTVNYKLLDIVRGDYLHVQEISSEDLELNLVKYDSVSSLNLSEFINSLKTDSLKKEEAGGKPIEVDQINLSNFRLRMIDKTKIPNQEKLDFANIDFLIQEFGMNKMEVRPDTVIASLFQFVGYDINSGFQVNNLNTSFRLTSQSLSIDDLDFQTPTSIVTDSLEFFYNGLDDFGHFVDSVSFILHLKESIISTSDFKLLTGTDHLKNDLELDGIFWGAVGDFNIEEASIRMGSTFFKGGVSCFGLPDPSKTFILADITKSRLLPTDLEPYVGEVSENLRHMGRIDFTGSFAGFLNDFVAKGDIYTDHGFMHGDINIKIPTDPSMMSYSGYLELDSMDIGAFFENDIVQKINLQANIDGEGITVENADLDLDAKIFHSGLKGYVYDSLTVNGHFAKNFFRGSLVVDDPNCQLKGKAEIDFRSESEQLDLNFDIEKMLANELKLITTPLEIKGAMDLKVNDLNVDNFQSELTIDSSYLNIDGKILLLDSVRFTASLEDSLRVIKYDMPGINGEVSGFFDISDVLKDIPNMAIGYARKLQLTKDTVSRTSSGKRYRFNVSVNIEDITPYLDSLDIPLKIYSNTFIEGSFRHSRNSNVSLYIQSDSITINGNSIHEPIIEINGSRGDKSNRVLTNFLFTSKEQHIPGVPHTNDLSLEGVWFDDNIDLTTRISQPETATRMRLESNFKLREDSLILKMLPSDIHILDDTWNFNPTNQIIVKTEQTIIENFEIFDSSESIRLNGVISDSLATSIDISVEDLNMNKANLFTENHVSGYLNGNFQIFRTTSQEAYRFDGGFFLRDLMYDELLIGDVGGSSNWDPDQESIYSNVEITREGFNSIKGNGYYYPQREGNELDFDLKFNQADLIIARPFLKENFSNFGGFANGAIKIIGGANSPKVVGNCAISDGTVTVNYLNTSYTFSGEARFDPNQIALTSVDLTDRKGSHAILTGNISHESFSNFLTNLEIRSSGFEFLNTTSVENELYYGSAYGSGSIKVTGPLNDLLIKADMRTDQGTRLFIPVTESSDGGQESYIEFIDFSDTTTHVQLEEAFAIQGLTLDFDIEVTPDAYCELIFDIKTGDIIRGRGRGNIKLRLDTDGEFNMFGPLEITEGAYNFTLNFINKEFEVVPGSIITWYGDPYNATLDLEATYLQRASFEELKNPEDQVQADLAQKVPLLVVLLLDGGMLSPQIDFDIRLQNEGDARNEDIPLLTQITSDEQELRRQVISLLFLKRFSPRQSFALGGGGSIGSSVSEFLSNQVSYLVSQIDENLEVEVNLADLNQEAFNTFQLRFAYTFLGGRLKVTRGGSFGNQEDQNDNVLNDIVGNWSVEYSLTRDGRLRAKVFRNANQRLITSDGQQTQEAGFSLRFVHSFNDLRELLTFKREEALRRREDELDEAPSDSTSNPVPNTN